jgi:formate dehydrogenase major subunit
LEVLQLIRKEHGVMDVSRRGFLKISGAALMASGIGINLKPVAAHAQPLKIKYAKETTTICPYCAVGCGIIVSARNGKVINTEGDPDHPVNQGSLCSKGGSIYQLSVNENRMDKVLYRAPYATEWKEVSWDWALDKIAKNIKESRDKSFVKRNTKGQVVNRTDGLASVGSAAMDNEECYIYQKFLRGLGLVYIEHQARI